MSSTPATLGPYSILKLLGSGGMGEIFLARDERLDRYVAIKRNRADRPTDRESRRRFRREARLAARLNHPSIAQIYDVLELDSGDGIVMEYVEGTDLHELLRQGPLEGVRLLSLGAEIADGLAAAHRLGIVHRDLKSENVLITPLGHAKIVDFGIAKHFQEGSEEVLTRGPAVLGTYRAMSPEQARGQSVDHRSDLFSLGILLYEAATSTSPFEGDNELQTLHRIVEHQQPSLRELQPQIPTAFSTLVDQLLQKEPLLRPRSASEVRDRLLALAEEAAGEEATWVGRSSTSHAADEAVSARGHDSYASTTRSTYVSSRLVKRPVVLTLLLIGLALTWRLMPPPEPTEPIYVAVSKPLIASEIDDEELELLAAAARDALIRQLIALEGVAVKSPQQLDAIPGTPLAAARAVAADELIGARLDCRPEACQLSLNRTSTADGTVLWSKSVPVPTDNFFLAANVASNHLRQAYPEYSVRKGSPRLEVTAEDLRAFLSLRQQFHELRQQAPLDKIQSELGAIHRSSPGFIDAYLLAAHVAIYRFYYSRDRADRELAWQALERARQRAPEDPQILSSWFHVALQSGLLDEAGQALEELEQVVPGDVSLLVRRAQLLDARGENDRAIEVLRMAVERRSGAETLYLLALLEHQQGDITSSQGHLQELLRRVPTSFEGRSLLAQLEMFHGDLEKAVEIYRDLVRESPRLSELSNLGVSYLLLRRYREASEQFQRAVELVPRNPFFNLNLADGHLLLGHHAEAERLYRRVVELIERDEAAADAQFLAVKAQALAHLGDDHQAAAAAQDARLKAPTSGPIAFEVALSYAVIGDHSSALVNAELALERGVAPRWFTLPWFDELRDLGELVVE